MENVLKHSVIWNNTKGAYDVRWDLIKEQEGIKYVEEKDYTWIHFKSCTCLIPSTEKGVKILKVSYDFIENLLRYEKKIIEELKEFIDDKVIPKTSIDNFKKIVSTYDELNINWLQLKNEYILILKNVENYKFNARLEIASLTSIEVLIRLLNQDVSITDIKKLKVNDNFTPIIFPIKASPKINFRYRQRRRERENRRFRQRRRRERESREYRQTILNNFYKGNINLLELIELGHLKLNTHEED